MTEKNKGKKLLTLTLALSMTLALPPAGVYAEENAADGNGAANQMDRGFVTLPAMGQPVGLPSGDGENAPKAVVIGDVVGDDGEKDQADVPSGGQTDKDVPPPSTDDVPEGKAEETMPEVDGGNGGISTFENEGGEDETPVAKVEYAATIGEEKYKTLEAAMTAAKPQDTIVLQKDITITEQKDNIEVKVSKGFEGELTIDLNNHFIDGSNSYKCIWRTGNPDCCPSKLIVKNGTLKNGNPGEGSIGGAIQWVGNLEVDNCFFENNKGCAMATSSGTVKISNSTFTGNESDKSGGAIQITGNEGCTIHNCTFSGNTVTGEIRMGGAVYIDHGETAITKCSFTDNSAAYGGAIAVADATGINISQNTAFSNNIAAYGGAIYIQGITYTPNLSLSTSTIGGNSANYGGGIYAYKYGNVTITEDVALYNNTASTAADDLFLYMGTFTLPDADKMSGDRKLASDNEAITGWFYDGWGKPRWAEKTETGNYYDEYVPKENDTTYLSLKAAHEQLYKVTVHYVYSNGATAAKDKVINVKAGAAYSIDSPAIEGYKADKATVSGTIPADTPADTVITVTYTKESSGGGGGHHPKPKPTVEIPDEDALGLNDTDHFAYIVGYGHGDVQPQNSITRAEVAAIFFRLLEDGIRSENFTHQNAFSDVAADAWYCSSVSTLSRMGIIAGYPDGTFRPNAPITRAEFAAIATRFDNNGDKTPVNFKDIIGHWAEGEITVAANHGWVSGYGDGTFRPQNRITRAETMSLVNRVLKRIPETPADLLPDMITWTDNTDTNSWYYLPVQEATNSHYYEFKDDSKYEKWTELRETRDWSELG